jgi:hypothetical protein
MLDRQAVGDADDVDRLSLDHVTRRSRGSPQQPRHRAVTLLEQILDRHVKRLEVTPSGLHDEPKPVRSDDLTTPDALVVHVVVTNRRAHRRGVAGAEHHDQRHHHGRGRGSVAAHRALRRHLPSVPDPAVVALAPSA